MKSAESYIGKSAVCNMTNGIYIVDMVKDNVLLLIRVGRDGRRLVSFKEFKKYYTIY